MKTVGQDLVSWAAWLLEDVVPAPRASQRLTNQSMPRSRRASGLFLCSSLCRAAASEFDEADGQGRCTRHAQPAPFCNLLSRHYGCLMMQAAAISADEDDAGRSGSPPRKKGAACISQV